MSIEHRPTIDELSALRRRVRLVLLIHAAEQAGLAPLPIRRLHILAYLSNVLAPVWDLPALDGKVLKRQGGPFYPALQRDLDGLVGRGLAIVSGLTHVQNEDKRWRLDASYKLNPEFARPILDCVAGFEEEGNLLGFVQELALALSALSDGEIDAATTEDATYTDPLVDLGNVVDFAEWQTKNYTANAANRFERLIPSGARAGAGEKVHLYVRHLRARMHGNR